MATDTRIYVVTHKVDGSPANDTQHLVRASSQSQAIRHVVAEKFDAYVASQDALVHLLGKGVKVEDAASAPS
jgi:hypothetical protein